MIRSLTIFLFPIFINTVVARNYLSANSFIPDNTTSRASVRIATGRGNCSGTLISSNLVYTAAHCLYDHHIPSVTVFHHSIYWTGYRVKRVFYPDNFGRGFDFARAQNFTRRNCGTTDCWNACVNENNWMWEYYMKLDYALILLEEHVPVCDNYIGPVAAYIDRPPISENGRIYEPAAANSECFVAGYGLTENPSYSSINMAIVDNMLGMDIRRCGTSARKGFRTRFHNSSETNGHRTTTCPGDSGAGFQCISKGGTALAVIGVNTKSDSAAHMAPNANKYQKCGNPHFSFALATIDHFNELWNKMEEWNELENYKSTYSKCYQFLQKHPYHSVMNTYLGRNPEFY